MSKHAIRGEAERVRHVFFLSSCRERGKNRVKVKAVMEGRFQCEPGPAGYKQWREYRNTVFKEKVEVWVFLPRLPPHHLTPDKQQKMDGYVLYCQC